MLEVRTASFAVRIFLALVQDNLNWLWQSFTLQS